MIKFKLKIITPQGIYQEVEIDQINLDTTAGQIGILAHHIPLASGVKVSQMNYIIDGKRTYFSIAGGFVYVNETETTLIANAIESQDDVKKFDFLGITLQYEMCYTNILQVLDLSNIPLLASDRTEDDPIVIGGGPCSYNPEPIASLSKV